MNFYLFIYLLFIYILYARKRDDYKPIIRERKLKKSVRLLIVLEKN